MREEGGETTRDYAIIADASYFEILLEEGIQGPPGPPGTGGSGGIRIEGKRQRSHCRCRRA